MWSEWSESKGSAHAAENHVSRLIRSGGKKKKKNDGFGFCMQIRIIRKMRKMEDANYIFILFI